MTTQLPIVVFDTCVLIGMLTRDPQYASAGQYDADRKVGQLVIAVSEITIAEACKLTSKTGQYQHEAVAKYFDDTVTTRRFPATAGIGNRAASLIRLFRLDTCDAMIVATALARGAKSLVTRDESSLCKRLVPKTKPHMLHPSVRSPNTDFEHGEIEKKVLAELNRLQIIPLPTPKPPESENVTNTKATAVGPGPVSESGKNPAVVEPRAVEVPNDPPPTATKATSEETTVVAKPEPANAPGGS